MGSIELRKIQAVYLHWALIPVFVVLLVLGIQTLNRNRQRTRNVLTPWTLWFLVLYSAVGGILPFFNKIGFTHYTLFWTFGPRIPYMLWSIGIALLPLAIVLVVQSFKGRGQHADVGILLALFPVLHSVMAVVYIFLGRCVRE